MEEKRSYQKLTETQLQGFLSRFQNFYDGLIREAQIFFMTTSMNTCSRVVLSVIDHQQVIAERWVNVTLEIENVSTFQLLEGKKQSCVVLSDGLNIKFFGGDIYLDFCPFLSEPEEIEDFLKSRFLIVGKGINWFVSPYTE